MSRRRPKKERDLPTAAATPAAADSTPAAPSTGALRRWLPPFLLVLLTAALWARSLAAPLHWWDDNVYIFDDPRLARLNWANVQAIFTTSFFANYHPVTTLTYALDHVMWGNWIPGYHLTQLTLYTAGVVVLYYALRRVLRSEWAALAAAALYSAHALHTEVVAWLASRKDIVCLVFYAGALLLYARYADRRDREDPDRPRWPWASYLAVLACSLLAMLSKGYAVVLPGVFLAYDLCFSRRFEGPLTSLELPQVPVFGWFYPRSRRVLLLDKVPLLLLALAVTAMTAASQGEASALLTTFDKDYGITPWDRAVVLLKVFALYAGRALLPVRLCAEYVVGKDSSWQPAWVAVVGAAALAAAVAGFFWWRNRKPAAAFGIALFVLPLATVMNTFFTLRIWMADRYLFLPTIGSALVLVAVCRLVPSRRDGSERRPLSADSGTRRASSGGRLRAGVAVAAVLFYAFLTTARLRVWMEPVLLWSDVLRKNYPVLSGEGRLTVKEMHDHAQGLYLHNIQPFTALAGAYEREGDLEQARLIKQGVRAADQGNLDVALADLAAGRFDEGVKRLTGLVEGGDWQAPQAAKALGDAYQKRGDLEPAREWYHRAYGLFRSRSLSGADALMGEGALEYGARNYARALELYRQLCEVAPTSPFGPFYEGLTLDAMGATDEALARYQAALDMNSNAPPGHEVPLADVHRQMGLACQKLHRYEDAVRHYEECLRLKPDLPDRASLEAAIASMRKELGR